MLSWPIACSTPDTNGDDQRADAEEQDADERDQRRNEEMPPPDRHAVVEDDRHRVLQDREGERAEEQQRDDEHPADDVAMLDEQRELVHDQVGLARHDELEVAGDRGQQLRFPDDMGQHDQEEDQQRQDRQQRVVGDRAREQVTLVGAKAAQNPQRKGDGMLQDNRCARAESGHGSRRRRQSGRTAAGRWTFPDVVPATPAIDNSRSHCPACQHLAQGCSPPLSFGKRRSS